MPIPLDFVGLNTLIQEPVDQEQNTIGYKKRKALRMPSTTTSITGIITGDVQSVYPSSGFLSISFWVKLDSGYQDGEYKFVVEADDNSDQNILIVNFRDGKLWYRVWQGAGGGSTTTEYTIPVSNPTSWNHYVIVANLDEAQTAPTMYINTNSISVTKEAGDYTGNIGQIAGILSLMGNDVETNGSELQGSLQEFAFYNKSLNQDEINEIYEAYDLTKTSLNSNIIDYWTLGEEPEFDNFSEGRRVTDGLSFNATKGSTSLTIDQNIYISSGYVNPLSYKNSQIASLPTGSYLAALNIHRNGPYGWPAFKSTRIGQNPLTRYQNKNSIFSYVLDGGMKTVTQNGKLRDRFRERRGALNQITESPIYSNHKPLRLLAKIQDEEVEILTSPGNETQYFGDEQTNRHHNAFNKKPKSFYEMLNLYKTNELEKTPLDSVTSLNYYQTIFPKAENSGLNAVREREIFYNSIWNDDRELRANIETKKYSFGVINKLSKWPLDGLQHNTEIINEYVSGNIHHDGYIYTYFHKPEEKYPSGLLRKNFNNFFSNSLGTPSDFSDYLKPSPCYFASLESNFSSSFNIYHKQRLREFWLYSDASSSLQYLTSSGYHYGINKNYLTPWTAPATKKPFYNSYKEYSEEIKYAFKDFSIIPEYTISSFVESYLENGLLNENDKNNFLNLTGSSLETSNNFYKILSTSDLLKNFDLIQEENNEIIKPHKLVLKCKAILKLLPYESFYPVKRTIDIADKFIEKYKNQIVSSSANSNITDIFASGAACLINSHLFAPGVLYNTIKSGIAVDYPVYDSDNLHTTYYKGRALDGILDDRTNACGGVGTGKNGIVDRIPFEALISPGKVLSNYKLNFKKDQILHGGPYSDFSQLIETSLGEQDNPSYQLMINNFLAETTNFFMKNENYTTITSLPQGDPNFGNAEANKTYRMRLKMYSSTEGIKNPIQNYGGVKYQYPQHSGSIQSTFLMWSNPQQFGGDSTSTFLNKKNKISIWDSYIKNDIKYHYKPGIYDYRVDFYSGLTSSDTSLNHLYDQAHTNGLGIAYSGSFYSCGQHAYAGENYIASPPYYHGEAWADITFKPTETKKYSLNEILNNSSVEFYRYYDHTGLFKPKDSRIGKITGSFIVLNDDVSLNSTINIGDKIRFYIWNEQIASVYATSSAPSSWTMDPYQQRRFEILFTTSITPESASINIDPTGLTNTEISEAIVDAINGDSNSAVTFYTTGLDYHSMNTASGIPSMTAKIVTSPSDDFTHLFSSKINIEVIHDGFLNPFTKNGVDQRYDLVGYRSNSGMEISTKYSSYLKTKYGMFQMLFNDIHDFGRLGPGDFQTGRSPLTPFFAISSSNNSAIKNYSNRYWTFAQPSGLFYDGDLSEDFNISVNRYDPRFIRNHNIINEFASQMPSSVNILSKGVVNKVEGSTNIEDSYRWIIQTKYETPMLNFIDYEWQDNLHHYFTVTSDSTYIKRKDRYHNYPDIGMWLQNGRIPATDEGVFLQVVDIPKTWTSGALGMDPTTTGSLAELCGFTNEPVKMGEIKDTKVIKEGVVLVPFVEREGERKFFNISKEDIKYAKRGKRVGLTLIEQVRKMQEFVIPPSFDFLRNQDIEPFAMYIFEFTHTLSKQDLADIWQGLLPDIGRNHEIAEVTISHELLSNELLGSGLKVAPDPRREDAFIFLDPIKESFIEPDIQWMVFKVKQRAASNYFEKIFERNESNLGDKTRLDELSTTSTGANLGVQYNWPYDFFSLVELVKIDAEVEFANTTTTDEGISIAPINLSQTQNNNLIQQTQQVANNIALQQNTRTRTREEE